MHTSSLTHSLRLKTAVAACLAIAGVLAASSAMADDDQLFIDASHDDHVVLNGQHVNGDVIAHDTSQVAIDRSATDTTALPLVEGNIETYDASQATATSTHIFGNVTSNGTSLVILTNAEVEGNLIVNDDAIVALDDATVVHGNIQGLFLAKDAAGYSIYVNP